MSTSRWSPLAEGLKITRSSAYIRWLIILPPMVQPHSVIQRMNINSTLKRNVLQYAASFKVKFNLHIVIIHILHTKAVAVLVDMVRKVQRLFTRPLLAKYFAAQTILIFLAVCRRCTSRKTRVVAPEMFGLTCRVGAHISCYAHDTRLYPIPCLIFNNRD